jgi:hypothetical protein
LRGSHAARWAGFDIVHLNFSPEKLEKPPL